MPEIPLRLATQARREWNGLCENRNNSCTIYRASELPPQEETVKYRLGSFLIPSVIAALAFASPARGYTPHVSTASPATSAELHTAMRKLWSDHVLWTRQY